MANVTIIGAGSWALALGNQALKCGHRVTLWEFRADICSRLDAERAAEWLLPGFTIPGELNFTSDLCEAVSDAEMLLVVVPSHTMRIVAKQLYETGTRAPLVTATKGLELKTHLRMTEVLLSELKNHTADDVVALSGPSHAEEVVKGSPTAVVIAGANEAFTKHVQQALAGPTFRLYTSHDVVGVEIGGALKNVIAIATGVCDGLGYGDNTKGLLMTRGLSELTRLGTLMGGDPRTFFGLSGVGDLITTCMSRHSRNRYVGEQLGRGRKIDEIIASMTMVAEGVNATNAAVELAAFTNTEMPIAQAMFDVMYSGKPIQEAALGLMTRALKRED